MPYFQAHFLNILGKSPVVLDFPTFTHYAKFDEDEIIFYAFECQKDESQRDSSSHGDVMNLLIVGCVRVPGFVPIKLMRDEKNETLPRKEIEKKRPKIEFVTSQFGSIDSSSWN